MSGKIRAVEVKGTKDGLLINISEHLNYEETKNCIEEMISSNIKFFKGANVISLRIPHLDEKEGQQLLKSLKKRFQISFDIRYGKKILEEQTSQKEEESDIIEENKMLAQENHKPSKFIRMTMRSGSSVEFDGNIVVLGDVNPGAQIVASGNIIVMGSLRGLAHAGCRGDAKAFVAANKLEPLQLRIAHMIAISPEDSQMVLPGPQLAYINDKHIVIETCSAKG